MTFKLVKPECSTDETNVILEKAVDALNRGVTEFIVLPVGYFITKVGYFITKGD